MIALNNVFSILKMAMVLAFSIGVLPALCQKKVTVVGTVTDSSGVPLANVSISVQGTGSGSQIGEIEKNKDVTLMLLLN